MEVGRKLKEALRPRYRSHSTDQGLTTLSERFDDDNDKIGLTLNCRQAIIIKNIKFTSLVYLLKSPIVCINHKNVM